jgi:Esterase-like activity of phytase
MAAPGILARLARLDAGFVMAVGTAVGAGCASAPPAQAPAPSRAASTPAAVAAATSAPSAPSTGQAGSIPALELMDVAIVPPGDMTAPRERRFGSLSGLVRDERTGRYLAVIDDRLPARVTWLDISYTDGHLSVTPLGVEPVTAGPGVDPRIAVQADLEAVVALPDGTFVGSEEGHLSRGEVGEPPAGTWPVALLTLSPTMAVTAVHPWPAAFSGGPEGGGIRNNQGAEALTRTPDGRLIAGLERPLFADLPGGYRNDRPFNDGQAGPGRLVEFVSSDGRWQARRQWMYPIERTETRAGFDTICDDGENGLTELLALDNTRFLALERSCLQNAATRMARNTGRLFLVDVEGADDVSGVTGLASAPVRGVAKTLLIDFDTLIPRLPASLANLDNFEGLAFGPTLPDGSRTLLVLSDDNFRPTQKTVLLLFRIGPKT